MSGRKTFSSIPLDLVIGSLWIKLIKDISTGEKTNSKSHIFAEAHRKMWLKEAVRIWSLYTILTNSNKLWRSDNTFVFGVISRLTWRRQWHPTPVLLPGKSHGRRSLVGCSPWGREESDMTERLPFHFSLSCIGEGNGNPLQCSCLENPRDSGAWWAAVYGVAQSRTWLKRFSSSKEK